ncbi:MAG: hypothetical protein WCL08_00185 [Verrucomicrobiota bacterium]
MSNPYPVFPDSNPKANMSQNEAQTKILQILAASIDPVTGALTLPVEVDANIASLEIKGGNTTATADVVTDGGTNALRVISQDLDATHDTVSIGDGTTKALVDSTTKGLQVKVMNLPETQQVSGNVNSFATQNTATISYDAAGRHRMSSLTTLFDGKTLNSDNTYIFDNVGTGTGAWAANKYNMSVTAGQYFIRQAKRFSPYFSGKSHFVEATMDGFNFQAGVTKRFGYFSSSTVAPYDTVKDGWWIENDGTKLSFIAQRAGVGTVNVPWTSWDNYNLVKDVNFDNFNVWAFDFLWLGGAVIRIFLKTTTGFVLCHTYHYATSAKDVFILSPNQPIRYEIRSTGGVGSFRYICSQVATEGSINEEGYNGAVNTGTAGVSLAAIGTKYPVKAVRKKSTHRDTSVKVTGLDVILTTQSDQALWTLELSPTLSAPLTFTDGTETAVEQATGNGTITVTAAGRILSCGYIATGMKIPNALFEKDYLVYMGATIAGVSESLVLCVTPITQSITANVAIGFKENTN